MEQNIQDLMVIVRMTMDEHSTSLDEEIEQEAAALEQTLLRTLQEEQKSPRTDSADDALITIRAGSGGAEAQDWARMLAAMYTGWAAQERTGALVLDQNPGNQDGLRSITIRIPNAFQNLRAEHGVHRLVRISPFDKARRRQTSWAAVEVLTAPPEHQVPSERRESDPNRHHQHDRTAPRSRELGSTREIPGRDIRMEAFRASGPGGQSVNKLATAVRLTHIPTGITAVCRTERSQLQNRQSAMTILIARIRARENELQDAARREQMGEKLTAEWGHRVRSYFLHPRQQVLDHRTGAQTAQAARVLEGWLEPFLTKETGA